MDKILCLCIFWLAPLLLSASPPPKLQLSCLQKCHESYCARAKKAFAESERLVFTDFLQSRWEYEQGCLYLQRARCGMCKMEILHRGTWSSGLAPSLGAEAPNPSACSRHP